MNAQLEKHPCFNPDSRHSYARIHLPVAPACNVQCRFCDRKFSCVNESRPGVTAKVMTPHQALDYLKQSMAKVPNISVVGIAGPGDPFANPEATLETFRLVKESFPELMLCVSSNGLRVMPYVAALKRLGVAHVTITVNAVDPAIGASVYDWVRWNDQAFHGKEAAHILFDNQEAAIQALASRDILVKVNTVCIPGVNDLHVEDISRTVASWGASLHNVIPLIPTPNTAFADLAEPTPLQMRRIRHAAQKYLPQMEHCSRCRADAVGLLGQKNPGENAQAVQFAARVEVSSVATLGNRPVLKERPYVAVSSRQGVLVDMHLGESETLRIYSCEGNKPKLIDVRKTPAPHSGSSRWVRLAEILGDCSALYSSGVGPIPRTVLSTNGIQVKIVEGLIEEVIGQAPQTMPEEKPFHCGESCGGDALGCHEDEAL